MREKIRFATLMLLLCAWGVGMFPEGAAAQNVSGHYLEKTGDRIGIELEIAPPLPPLVIVIQKLPVGVQVVEASPPSKLADLGRGQVKWLLSGLAAGKHRLELKLDRPAAARAGGGEIRYRDPADGKLVTVAIVDRVP